MLGFYVLGVFVVLLKEVGEFEVEGVFEGLGEIRVLKEL